MENIMPSEKDKYFLKWLEEKFDNTDSKIDANTKLTKEVRKEQKAANDRLSALEKEVFPATKNLPPWYRDPKIIQIIMYIALAFLLLVAAVTRFDVGKLL